MNPEYRYGQVGIAISYRLLGISVSASLPEHGIARQHSERDRKESQYQAQAKDKFVEHTHAY